ncbi:hypothetical protein [Kribbella sp. NPDC048928]|uniref:hypothetical protein n=1 Tax=Kribbella sp. NPDC048928 TaxID=3364111 RepID=UPI003714E477
MTAPWTTVLARVAEQLNAHGVDWMLLGSAATALRGAAVVPGDIDIAGRTEDDIVRAAAILPTPQSAPADGPADWISTAAAPVLHFGGAEERWTFGRWMIDGVKVELAHIDAPAVDGLMLETRSPLVWAHRQNLDCHGQPIPVVPLEVQLVTMIARHQDARLAATLAAVDPAALDLPLLRRAIADKQSEDPTLALPEPIRTLAAVGGLP